VAAMGLSHQTNSRGRPREVQQITADPLNRDLQARIGR